MNYQRPENIASHIVYDPLYIYCAKQGNAADPLRWQYQEHHGLLMWDNELKII
jgi:hypothetical protein